METRSRILIFLALFFVARASQATDRYVNVANPSPALPYTSWSSAAVNIQDAIDSATAGDRIIVTNGVYQTGGRAFVALTNRVLVDKAVTVESVLGPEWTIIQGHQVPGVYNSPDVIRCVYLAAGAVLSGFTLTNGATAGAASDSRDLYGGGVYCESTNAIVTNCVLVGNSALLGGGAYSGTLRKCTIEQNIANYKGGGVHFGNLSDCLIAGNLSASYGGGASTSILSNCILLTNTCSLNGGGAADCNLNACWILGNVAYEGGGAMEGTLNNCVLNGNAADSIGGAWNATLNNCTLTGNFGGGAGGCTLNNCIVYFNQGRYGWDNWFVSTLNYCCTTPLPPDGVGNFESNPQLASISHIGAASPCRSAGSSLFATGSDIDSEPWASPPAVGCDEYSAGAVTGLLDVAIGLTYTNVAVGYSLDLNALIDGRTVSSVWDFGDGQSMTNQAFCSHAWSAPGDYRVTLSAFNESNPGGVSATSLVHVVPVPFYYVASGSAHPTAPYATWATAASDIQSALDVSIPGAQVVVSNGVYATGGRVVFGAMTNRVAIDKPVLVRSVNGPSTTFIQGYRVPGTNNGDGAIRCVYLANGAELSGFTLSGGATRAGGNVMREQQGGGAWCELPGAVLSNCVITANNAFRAGAGVSGGTLNRCTVRANTSAASSSAGGTLYSTLNYCTVANNSVPGGPAGGSYGGTLNYCIVANNSGSYGGGAVYCTLNNCVLYGNSVSSYGGAAYGGTLNQCTLSRNQASFGGGAYQSTLTNCVAYFNTASTSGSNYGSSSLSYCCTMPMPTNGVGNITNAPIFANLAGNDFHLWTSSPGINAGLNAGVLGSVDLDNRPRIVDGTVDMGAYEFQGPDMAQYLLWLRQFGLPTDSSSDSSDADLDGGNNWQEWVAGTNPTNSGSVLRLFVPTSAGPGWLITWQAVTNRSYFVERSGNLGDPSAFQTLAENVPGQIGTASYLDMTAPGGPSFYRVGIWTSSYQPH